MTGDEEFQARNTGYSKFTVMEKRGKVLARG